MSGSKARGVAMIAATALLTAACSGGGCEPCNDVAAPVEPPPYGEEESNVEVWLETLEVGSRELYAAREAVVEALDLPAGARIADIGAGTGLYSLMFADKVDAAGVVYAIDIEPRFLKLINQRASDLDLSNVVSVLGREDDITLPPGSVDYVFVADTYHYFSDRESIMRSIYEALSANGKLFVLDYTLEAGDADDTKKDHVRFGKAGVINELKSFSFELVDEPQVEGLNEIYMVVMTKAGG